MCRKFCLICGWTEEIKCNLKENQSHIDYLFDYCPICWKFTVNSDKIK